METQEMYKQRRLAEIEQRREKKRRQRIRRKICTLITLTAICTAAAGSVYTASAKEITITEINEFEGTNKTITVTTRANDVKTALDEQGISVSSTDKVNIDENSEINDSENIVVRRGKEIKVVTPSSEETVVVTSADTHEALKEAGYAADELDDISMDGSNIAESETVELKNVYVTYETATEEIPFETVYEDDPSIYVGEEQVATEGVPGEKKITYKVSLYEDGTEKERTAENEEITSEPVNEVIKRGTKPEPTAAPVSSKSSTVRESAGTINGMSYSRKITMNATAYTSASCGGNNVTALGTTLRYGVVAVDPSVIPLGSKLYIVSADGKYNYGVAVAEDTGGAIKGNKIDLCFMSMNECLNFGRRDCIVYVLD